MEVAVRKALVFAMWATACGGNAGQAVDAQVEEAAPAVHPVDPLLSPGSALPAPTSPAPVVNSASLPVAGTAACQPSPVPIPLERYLGFLEKGMPAVMGQLSGMKETQEDPATGLALRPATFANVESVNDAGASFLVGDTLAVGLNPMHLPPTSGFPYLVVLQDYAEGTLLVQEAPLCVDSSNRAAILAAAK